MFDDIHPTRLAWFIKETRAQGILLWPSFTLLFVILTNLHLAPFSGGVADSILRVIGFIYPASLEQYAEILRVGIPADGARFGAFIAGALFVEAFLIGRTFKEYFDRGLRFEPNMQDWIIAFVSLCIVIFVLCFDTVEEKPKAFRDFIVDPFGLFYIRQAVALYAAGYGVTTIALVLLAIVPNRNT